MAASTAPAGSPASSATLSIWWDTWIIDGAVRLGSFVVKVLSYPVRILQTGHVQAYALFVVVGRAGVLRLLRDAVMIWTSTYSASSYSRRWPGCWSCCFLPASQQEPDPRSGRTSSAFAGFLVSLPLVSRFDTSMPGLPVRRAAPTGFPALGVKYHIGIDGISLLLIMLTT